MKVRLTAPARADLLAHSEWLLERSSKAADDAVETILAVLDLLADFPQLGTQRDDDGTREKPVRFGRHGYIIRYEVEADVVVVLRVFHSRQDR